MADFFLNSVSLIGVSWQFMPERFVNFFIFFSLQFLVGGGGRCDYGSIIGIINNYGSYRIFRALCEKKDN